MTSTETTPQGPDPEFLATPARGGAVDRTGRALDTAGPSDALTPLPHHARIDVFATVLRNRLPPLGPMTAAGRDFYRNAWRHYRLFDASYYPLPADADLDTPML